MTDTPHEDRVKTLRDLNTDLQRIEDRMKILEVLIRPARREALMDETTKRDEPKKSLAATLVERHTTTSLLSVFGRTVDKVAEELAHDLLRDPEFRAEIQQLVRLAFQRALTELHDPAPPASERSRLW